MKKNYEVYSRGERKRIKRNRQKETGKERKRENDFVKKNNGKHILFLYLLNYYTSVREYGFFG